MKTARLISAAFCLFVSSCSADTKTSLVYNDVGTDLYSASLPDSTRRLDDYTGYICQSAGLTRVDGAGRAVCPVASFKAKEWNDFVQMGVYDIDQRCDRYLAWLDAAKRSKTPIANQISGTARLTNQVLLLTGTAMPAISIVAAAFGYASDTFTNVQSSLLIELDHSTVQSVVYGIQNKLKDEISTEAISSKPQALSVLRTYLRSCMPFTIATEVNTQLSTLGRNGVVAGDLLTTDNSYRGPATPDEKPHRPPQQPPVSAYAKIIDPNELTLISTALVKSALKALCVDTDPNSVGSARTQASIGWYLQDNEPGRLTNKRGYLTLANLSRLNDQPGVPCTKTFPKNYFEKMHLPNGLSKDIAVIQGLNKALNLNLSAGSTLQEMRAAIKAYRKDQSDELDPDVYAKLVQLSAG